MWDYECGGARGGGGVSMRPPAHEKTSPRGEGGRRTRRPHNPPGGQREMYGFLKKALAATESNGGKRRRVIVSFSPLYCVPWAPPMRASNAAMISAFLADCAARFASFFFRFSSIIFMTSS